jgi:hypothetical protein
MCRNSPTADALVLCTTGRRTGPGCRVSDGSAARGTRTRRADVSSDEWLRTSSDLRTVRPSVRLRGDDASSHDHQAPGLAEKSCGHSSATVCSGETIGCPLLFLGPAATATTEHIPSPTPTAIATDGRTREAEEPCWPVRGPGIIVSTTTACGKYCLPPAIIRLLHMSSPSCH